MLKRVTGFEGASGSFKTSERDAIADIIANAQFGHASRMLSGEPDDQSSFCIEVQRLRMAIIAAAEIIKKQKSKPRR
jgi:hypothetical protein